jgi:hypothetical protein
LPHSLFDGHEISAEEYQQVKDHAVAGFKALKSFHMFTARPLNFSEIDVLLSITNSKVIYEQALKKLRMHLLNNTIAKTEENSWDARNNPSISVRNV